MKHLGPTAQDFQAAFGLGDSDKSIGTVDEAGVALAAIQGLNEKVENGKQKAEDRMEKLESENAGLKRGFAQKETEITELKQRLEQLEQFINHKLNENAK